MEAHTAVQSGRAQTFRSVETGSCELISLAAAHINPEWRWHSARLLLARHEN